jgi:hypothetical protein
MKMVSIRIMWNTGEEEQDAKYTVEKITKEFKKLKRWSCSISKTYNRRNSGGRIYINLWKR